MFKEETIKTLKNIDKLFTELKVETHTLDKLGYNVENIYKQLEDLGIEIYKFKKDKGCL